MRKRKSRKWSSDRKLREGLKRMFMRVGYDKESAKRMADSMMQPFKKEAKKR